MEEKRFYQKARFWRWTLLVLFLLGVVYTFREQLSSLWAMGKLLIHRKEQIRDVIASQEVEILGLSFLAFVIFFIFILLAASQFVLPVRTLEERGKAFNRILRYLVRKHGPAVFIKEAGVIEHEAELEGSQPGVMFVDVCSAIALENQRVSARGERSPEVGAVSKEKYPRIRLFDFLRRPNLPRREPAVRVAGPGLVFTERGERLRGVADMRKQFRLVANASFATRDGFSVYSNVFIIFTLGEKPETLKVTCLGDTPADIRTVQVDPWTKRITGFRDELDNADKAEIFQFINTYQPETVEEILPPRPTPPVSQAPYLYDPLRVFAAIYSDSQNEADDTTEPWTALPARVAVDVFRDMLSLWKFNDLYRPDAPFDTSQEYTFPFLERFRPEFNRRMRNLGVLAFQAGRRRDGRLLREGDTWDVVDMTILPERELRNSKVLRDRGIRVIAAGFPELNPAHPGVRQQLVHYWSARWQQEAGRVEAEHWLEAQRVQTRAHAEGQRDMVDVLRRIYGMKELNQAALIIKLFQALEHTAGEPRTRQLLPKESLEFLLKLRDSFLPAGKKLP